MAIDQTKYQLTHLLQDAWYRMGQLRRWIATGGSTTTVINTTWAGVEEQIFEDDDPALIAGTLVVLGTTDEAAPEGEWGEITDYDSSSQTITMRTVGAAVGAGDRVGIASPLFPVEDMIELANIAMQKLGEVDVPYTGITVAANQTEYSLPSYISERPVRVRQQTLTESNNNQWEMVYGWDVIPQAVGTQWKLVLPSTVTQGYAIEVLYRGAHPELTAFDSEISPSIPRELAVCALLAEALQWYNNALGGANQYFLQRENKAIQDLEQALVRFPVHRYVGQVTGFAHWGLSGNYVPGTSDLRG